MKKKLARKRFEWEVGLRRRTRQAGRFWLLNPCLAAALAAAAGVGWVGAPERPSSAGELSQTEGNAGHRPVPASPAGMASDPDGLSALGIDLSRTAEVRGLIVSRPQTHLGRLRFLLRPRRVEQGGRQVDYPHLIQVSLPWESAPANRSAKAADSKNPPPSPAPHEAVLQAEQPAERPLSPRSASPRRGLDSGTRMLIAGDRVRFNAFLRAPTYFATPGAPDFRRILFLKGILHQVYLKSPLQLQRLPQGPIPFYRRPWRALQQAVAAYRQDRQRCLDSRAWKILAGVCLGLRPDWSDAEWMRLQRLGLVHLFVVSGLHVSLLLALFHRLLRRLGRLCWGRRWTGTASIRKVVTGWRSAAKPAGRGGPPSSALFADPGRTSPKQWIAPCLGAVLTLALLWCYVLLSGSGVPAMRAAVMGTLFYLLWIAGLQRQPLNALGLAGLLVLLAQPAALFQSGFHFSFLSLAAIGLFYLPRARVIDQGCRGCGDVGDKRLRLERTPSQRLRRRVRFALEERLAFADPSLVRRPLAWLTSLLRWVVPLAAISFFIQITTLPLALAQSNRWLWTQVPANLLLTPVVSLMLPLGLLDLLLWHVPWLNWFSLWTVDSAGFVCHRLMAWAEPWTVSSFLPQPRNEEIAVYFILLMTPHLLLRGRSRWIAYPAAPLMLYAWLSLPGMSLGNDFGGAEPQQGEAAASGDGSGGLPSSDGRHPAQSRSWLHLTLLDVGQGESIHVAYPGGESALIDTGGSWRNQGAFDFIGWKVTARYLWDVRSPALRYLMLSHGDSDHAGASAVIEELFRPRSLLLSWPQAAREAGRDGEAGPVRLQAGDAFTIGEVQHRILHPPRQGLGGDDNDDSLVMLVRHGLCSFLLTGDIESRAERRLLADVPPVAVLKVAHHGAAGSTSPGFLDRARPQLALISAGRNNRFGHPAKAVLQRLADRAIPWHSTAAQGSLRLTSDGVRWVLSAYLGPPGGFRGLASGPCLPMGHDEKRLQAVGQRH